MPFINGMQIDAGGKALLSTSGVLAGDAYLGGLRYAQATLALRAVQQTAQSLGPKEYVNATTPSGGFASGYRIGMTYRIVTAGEAQSLRFWRQSTSPLLTRQIVLWNTDTQAVLGSVTTTETTNQSGWVEVDLAAPIPLAANLKVTVGYNETNTHAGKSGACPVVNAAHAVYVNANYGTLDGFPTNVQAAQTYFADLSMRYVGPAMSTNDFPTDVDGRVCIATSGTIAAVRNGLAFDATGFLLTTPVSAPDLYLHGWPFAADGRLCVTLI